MKKLLLVLLVVALASLLFVGCMPVTPTEGEGEGEGEGEITVAIAGSVVVDGKTYVSGGAHTITVTFPAPVVGGVEASITSCSGDYRVDGGVVLFPNADKTIWTGSGDFGYGTGCCASYVSVTSGECVEEACIWFPVIVDSCYPFAEIEIGSEACDCAGCKITFDSSSTSVPCADATVCCDDTCSGLASWSVVLYDGEPFDSCCDPSVCEEPIGSCSGTACPISCETACLSDGTYYAIVTLVDAVGNETVYYAKIVLEDSDCSILVYEGHAADAPTCVTWDEATTDSIGACVETCYNAG